MKWCWTVRADGLYIGHEGGHVQHANGIVLSNGILSNASLISRLSKLVIQSTHPSPPRHPPTSSSIMLFVPNPLHQSVLRWSGEGHSQLWLPAQPVLAEDLGSDWELLAALEQASADNDLGAENGLVVVDVGGAVGAVVAVYWLACGGGRVSKCFTAPMFAFCGRGGMTTGQRGGEVDVPESP